MLGAKALLRSTSKSIRSLALQTRISRQYSSKRSTKGDLLPKILIANRGEIACRIIRTAKELGVETVAVYSDADEEALHIKHADESVHIGSSAATESYLKKSAIISAAKLTGARGIHPGYGFLSENPALAEDCEKNGIVFIGPPSSVIRTMGSKSESKKVMESINVPVVPGYHGEEQSSDRLIEEAKKIGFPVIVKPVMGGGGKGMKIAWSVDEMPAALESSRREALLSFADDKLLIEKYLTRPKHVEFQIFADTHGNCVHLYERDCSLQRRHQKIIEEAPAHHLTPAMRQTMGMQAVKAAKAVGYVGAGTIEFILDSTTKEWYFIEMNTRLQVEHPVTEAVTGLDLVKWQLLVASGQKLPITDQSKVPLFGHAFEARIYAENPFKNFMPTPGKLLIHKPPAEVRVDTGVETGDSISHFYDPMISKLTVQEKDRTSALEKLSRALDEYHVRGVHTNISFLRRVLRHPEYVKGNVETDFLEKYQKELLTPPTEDRTFIRVALYGIGTYLKQQCIGESSYEVKTPTGKYELFVTVANGIFSVRVEQDAECVKLSDIKVHDVTIKSELTAMVHINNEVIPICLQTNGTIDTLTTEGVRFVAELKQKRTRSGDAVVTAPMAGKVVKILAAVGQSVEEGEPIGIVEVMKMKCTINATSSGIVTSIPVNERDFIAEDQPIAIITC